MQYRNLGASGLKVSAIGLGTNQTVTEGCEFIGLKRTRAGSMKSEGNGGVLKIGNASNYLLVEGCNFEGNEANNSPTNGATAYFIYTQLCTWRYNYIECMGRASSIHNKRNNNPETQGATEISGNLFYKKASTGTNGQNIFEAAGTPRALFDNNLFASDVSCVVLDYTLSGRGGDTGWECQHFKNTFVSLGDQSLTTGISSPWL